MADTLSYPLGLVGLCTYPALAVHVLCCASSLSLQALTAVYGGFFIVLSYAWGWAVDKERPDAGKQTSRTGVAMHYQGSLQLLKHMA